MNDTVFWSWQNDLPGNTNRTFIREALAVAVRQVNEALAVKDANRDRVELDHDTQGATGIADISQTILEKISESAVMVADVTPIARSEGGKALPNPNVMVELGYAMGTIGFERIIAVLNTANGYTVESLPFDIRHRWILAYALSAGATEAERKTVREKLIKDLAKAIRDNINQARDARSANEPIEGVEGDPDCPGLWKADWPVSSGFGGKVRVQPQKADHRAWLRIIPEDPPGGKKPPITALQQLPDGARLWAPSGAGCCGDSGPCQFGFVTYWLKDPEQDETRLPLNIAAYLEETGEVWMSDGVAFSQEGEQKYIRDRHLLSNWNRGLEDGMACLDALGAPKRRRIILGVHGMEGAFWPEEPFRGRWSRKPGLLMDETKDDWTEDRREQLLHDTWNKLLDAFSMAPISKEDFARILESIA